jgi:hypothetical protein
MHTDVARVALHSNRGIPLSHALLHTAVQCTQVGAAPTLGPSKLRRKQWPAERQLAEQLLIQQLNIDPAIAGPACVVGARGIQLAARSGAQAVVLHAQIMQVALHHVGARAT